jgi:hypothetical protein
MLPYCRKMMGAEDRVEDVDKKENRPHGKMLQGPIRDAVGARSLADLKAPKSCLNLVRCGSLAGVWKYDSSVTSTFSITAGTE